MSKHMIIWFLSHIKDKLKLKQWCSPNAEKATHIKGRPLDQAVILFNCIPFQMGTSFKGKNLLPEKFLMVWKITLTTLGDFP